MKNFTRGTLLLAAFLLITACNCVTPEPINSSPTPQKIVQPTEVMDEEAIRTALAATLGLRAEDLPIEIQQRTATHTRGIADNRLFLAAKVDGDWQIVADGQAMPDCQAVEDYGFPPEMVPECSKPTPPSDEEAIQAALAAHLGQNLEDLSIVIEQNTGIHARGGVDNGYFLAAKVDDVWQVVADGQTMIDCKVVEEYEFPPGMVPECSNPNPPSDDEDIKASLAAHLGVKLYDLSIVIEQNTGTHARGAVDNGYFLAAKVDGVWQIVADGQAMPDCGVVSRFDFPPAMVPECHDSAVNKELCFKTGGTYTFVQNSMRAEEHPTYTLHALTDQTMIVSIASSNKDVFLGIEGLHNGKILLSTSEEKGSWTGSLPQTQDYVISLVTDNPQTDYFLTVEIPRNIHFIPGTTSTVVDGHIEVFDLVQDESVDNHVTYLVHALAGQTIDAQLSSPNLEALSMGVYGQEDGQPYLRYQVKNHGFHGVIPLSQVYYLKVFSNGPSTDFSLKITII